MKEIIVASILFAVAIVAFIMSILSFMEKERNSKLTNCNLQNSSPK